MTRTRLLSVALVLVSIPALGAAGLTVIGGPLLAPRFEHAASAALERPVSIDGGLHLAWWPRPTVVAEGVRLAARRNEPADPVELGRLELQPAILPLLTGRLVLERVVVADATITLGDAERGSGTAAGGARTDPGSAFALPPVRTLRAERIRLVRHGAPGEPPRTLTLDRLDGTLPDPAGPAELEATGVLDGRPVRLRVVVDSLAALRERRPVRLEPLAVELAGSDLVGGLTLDVGGPRPRLDGTLSSRRLDLAALRDLVRGPERPRIEPEPGRRGAASRAERVIPDRPLELGGLAAIDAELDWRIAELVTGGPVLRDVMLPVRLVAGRLRAEPVGAQLAGGRLTASFELDAGSPPVSLDLALDARGIATERLQREFAVEPSLAAPLDLRLVVAGRGGSLAALLATAEGELTATLGPGRWRARALERFAGGVREILSVLAGDRTEDWVPLRCGLFDLPIRAGVAELRVAILESDRARLVGEGRIDLADERLDLVLWPRPRAATLTVALPVRVRGPLLAPELSLDRREAARRAALGLVGALVFPPAALAAFADLGAGASPCLAAEAPAGESGASPSGPALPGADLLRRGLEGLLGGGRRRAGRSRVRPRRVRSRSVPVARDDGRASGSRAARSLSAVARPGCGRGAGGSPRHRRAAPHRR